MMLGYGLFWLVVWPGFWLGLAVAALMAACAHFVASRRARRREAGMAFDMASVSPPSAPDLQPQVRPRPKGRWGAGVAVSLLLHAAPLIVGGFWASRPPVTLPPETVFEVELVRLQAPPRLAVRTTARPDAGRGRRPEARAQAPHPTPPPGRGPCPLHHGPVGQGAVSRAGAQFGPRRPRQRGPGLASARPAAARATC